MEDKKVYALQWKNGSTLSNHGIFSSKEAAMESIEMWWKLNNFSPNYVKYWNNGNTRVVDYGLHHSFYHITEINQSNFHTVLFPDKLIKKTFEKDTVEDLELTISEIFDKAVNSINRIKPDFYI